jgi:hypothetical protein
MPGYIDTALTKYQHTKLTTPQHGPYQAAPNQYGANVQRVAADTSAPLNKAKIKRVQDIVGTLLYYTRAVDPTLLTALAQLPHARPMVPTPYTTLVTNFQTMWPRIQMQASAITLVT